VNRAHQCCAENLIIGQRVPPQVIIRAADGRTFELQDLLPADSRFKVLIFAGDINERQQREKINRLAEEMGKPERFLTRLASSSKEEAAFDILSISTTRKEVINYTDIPPLFRSHWSK
jgi:phenol 2-monooxygenase